MKTFTRIAALTISAGALAITPGLAAAHSNRGLHCGRGHGHGKLSSRDLGRKCKKHHYGKGEATAPGLLQPQGTTGPQGPKTTTPQGPKTTTPADPDRGRGPVSSNGRGSA